MSIIPVNFAAKFKPFFYNKNFYKKISLKNSENLSEC